MGMLVGAVVAVGLLVWAGATLLIDAAWRQRRPDLTDRLRPYQPSSVADEAQDCSTSSPITNRHSRHARVGDGAPGGRPAGHVTVVAANCGGRRGHRDPPAGSPARCSLG